MVRLCAELMVHIPTACGRVSNVGAVLKVLDNLWFYRPTLMLPTTMCRLAMSHIGISLHQIVFLEILHLRLSTLYVLKYRFENFLILSRISHHRVVQLLCFSRMSGSQLIYYHSSIYNAMALQRSIPPQLLVIAQNRILIRMSP